MRCDWFAPAPRLGVQIATAGQPRRQVTHLAGVPFNKLPHVIAEAPVPTPAQRWSDESAHLVQPGRRPRPRQ